MVTRADQFPSKLHLRVDHFRKSHIAHVRQTLFPPVHDGGGAGGDGDAKSLRMPAKAGTDGQSERADKFYIDAARRSALYSTRCRAQHCTVKIQNERDPSTSQLSNDVDLAPVDETQLVGARKPEPWQYSSFNSDAVQLTHAPTRWQLLLLPLPSLPLLPKCWRVRARQGRCKVRAETGDIEAGKQSALRTLE